METRLKIPLVICVLFMVALLVAPIAGAATPVAKLSAFKGQVTILSGRNFIDPKVGQALSQGDKIQTEKGEAEVTFKDGAVMKIRPFSNTMIQEQEEESGWWIFKTKKAVRRITLYVGKLWFKSGSSKRKNYLQTPTAVCGLRGTIAEWGHDLTMNYLNEIEGAGEVAGAVVRGAFADFGQGVFGQSNVTQRFTAARNAANAAAGDPGNQAAQDAADVAKLMAIKEALETLAANENLPPEAIDALNQALAQVLDDLGALGVDTANMRVADNTGSSTTSVISTRPITTTDPLSFTTTTTEEETTTSSTTVSGQ